MRIPDALASLADYGIIDEVVRPLMSGKEAQVYLVRLGGEQRVAKVYKEAENRTFKNRADYVEGRKVRNTRDQRAMGKASRHGRAQIESAWRTTEVDMIYRLHAAGVRVPHPYNFIDGVLVMEMITNEQGEPAPRLGDVVLDSAGAEAVFDHLLAEVVRMLAAGVVHGDLSDFNVLMGTDGPVIIDFPQAVDASSNRNARKLLLRDVDNLHRYTARFVPERRALPYAQEMWALYERGELAADTKLTGRHKVSEHKVSTEAVLGLIGDATRDERKRREHLGLNMRGAGDVEEEAPARPQSRYAQKREEKVAARKLEAANQPPPAPPLRSGQRDARGSAGQERPRARSAEHPMAQQRPIHAKPAHAKPAHARPAHAGNQAALPQRGAHAKPDHAKPDHAQPRHAVTHSAAPQRAGHERADHGKPAHAGTHPVGQRAPHAKADHARPQHDRQQQPAGGDVHVSAREPRHDGAADAAPKRRRRRRKRKTGDGAQRVPPR
jgi:RIO kinase 1